MMQQLVENLRKQAISDDEQRTSHVSLANRSITTQLPYGYLNDSGTESDEELEMIGNAIQYQKDYEDFLSGHGRPPELSDIPPTAEIDDVSWDSIGKESGILTGDGSGSDSEEDPTTPKQRRRMILNPTSGISKQQCEFPPMFMVGEKRRHADRGEGASTPQALPVNSVKERPRNIAVRRCPVRLLVNRPPREVERSFCAETSDTHLENHEPVKRSRLCRPTLDFDKMLRNRLDATAAGSVSPSSAFTSYSSQDN
ncbi:unnamed protein product [Auanema sp. JU1783]|nr:unnamed protein product [Auanema sp. JU1783]